MNELKIIFKVKKKHFMAAQRANNPPRGVGVRASLLTVTSRLDMTKSSEDSYGELQN